jgi:hypothetical protein
MNWKEELKRLKLEDIKAKAPGFFDLSGGYSMKVKRYCDKTTNGLTAAVYDWLKFNKHYVNRINVQGQCRVEKIEMAGGRTIEKLRYTPSMTNKGTADLMAIIKGLPVSIEIKCAATRDRQSEDQRKEQKRIEQAGGVYLIVTDMEQFVKWYKEFTI